ncbi:MAG: DinB family protein [Chitinophagaceae bacterium]
MFSDSQLYRLRYQHKTMRELCDGLTEAQLCTHVNEGKWSAHENIAHLVAYQPAFLARMFRIQQEEEPLFERYVADNDPAFAETVKQPTAELFDSAEADRDSIARMLLALDEASLMRTGIHARYGKLNVINWVEFFLLHEAHHLFTIFMLTADLRKMQA